MIREHDESVLMQPVNSATLRSTGSGNNSGLATIKTSHYSTYSTLSGNRLSSPQPADLVRASPDNIINLNEATTDDGNQFVSNPQVFKNELIASMPAPGVYGIICTSTNVTNNTIQNVEHFPDNNIYNNYDTSTKIVSDPAVRVRAKLAEDEIGDSEFRDLSLERPGSTVTHQSSHFCTNQMRDANSPALDKNISHSMIDQNVLASVQPILPKSSAKQPSIIEHSLPRTISDNAIYEHNDQPAIQNEFLVPDCAIQWVTLFQDKAEICRFVQPRVCTGQVTEVVFKKLSPYLDKDSTRVEVKGRATIQDVNLVVHRDEKVDAEFREKFDSLQSKIRCEIRHYEAACVKKMRLDKQRSILNSLADSLLSGGSGSGSVTVASNKNLPNKIDGELLNALGGENVTNVNKEADRYNPQHMEVVKGFFNIYEDRADKLDEELLAVRDEIDQLSASINEHKKALNNLEIQYHVNLNRELVVLVEAMEPGPIELFFSYVVKNASWIPAYDFRVFNDVGTLKVVYYGLVKQNTGENWETPRLTLSTSQPGVGGTVPELRVQKMLFRSTKNLPNDGFVVFGPKDKVKKCKKSKEKTQNTTDVSAGSISTQSVDQNNYLLNNENSYSPLMIYSDTPNSGAFKSTSNTLNYSQRQSNNAQENLSYISPGISPRSTLSGPVNVARDSPSPFLGSAFASKIRPISSEDFDRSSCSRADSSLTLANQNRHLRNNLDGTLDYQCANQLYTQSDTCEKTSSVSQSNMAGINFEIQHPPRCILSDNEYHRVTIGIIDMQPELEVIGTPKRSPFAFVKAEVKNSSKFPLLAGNTSIYMDNNYIGKSRIETIAPSEYFKCQLGYDCGVKFIYHPIEKVKVESSKLVSTTYKLAVEVKNSHPRPYKLTVYDQLPVSGEEKLKITLQEPVIKHPEKYDKSKQIRISKDNMIEWDLEMSPGETRILSIRYNIEHPPSEEAIFIEN